MLTAVMLSVPLFYRVSAYGLERLITLRSHIYPFLRLEDDWDLTKHFFQVHGVDGDGATVVRKQLRRAQVLAFFNKLPRCLVGVEACATAHYWAREPRALGGSDLRGSFAADDELRAGQDGWEEDRGILMS